MVDASDDKVHTAIKYGLNLVIRRGYEVIDIRPKVLVIHGESYELIKYNKYIESEYRNAKKSIQTSLEDGIDSESDEDSKEDC